MDDEIIIPGMSEREIYIRRRVRRLAEFYRHLATYLAVNIVLIAVNYYALNLQPPRATGWWAFFPAFGWGIGVIVHALIVFSPFGIFSLEWEERKVRELMERTESEPKP
ncbi:MAG: 2TM domain-containing protein [Casimicrobium sp.]